MTLQDLTNLSSEQLAGVGAALAAIGAACLSAWKQKNKPDATDGEKGSFGSVFRLHREDRQRIDDLGEKVGDLTRAIRQHGDHVEEHSTSLRRRGQR